MKRLLYTAIISLVTLSANAQVQGWDLLEKADFIPKFSPIKGDYVYDPIWQPELKQMDGKTIKIKGYYIPYDFNQGSIILSRYPYSSCFFCGGGGPESVVEVFMMDPNTSNFTPDQLIALKGTLELNKDDPNHLNFILRDAEIILE